MAETCIVPNCNSGREFSAERIAFFNIPENVELRNKWMEAIPKSGVPLNTTDMVCEKHFIETDIIRHYIVQDAAGKVVEKVAYDYPRLSDTAVPMIFPGLPLRLNDAQMGPINEVQTGPQSTSQGMNNVFFDYMVMDMYTDVVADTIKGTACVIGNVANHTQHKPNEAEVVSRVADHPSESEPLLSSEAIQTNSSPGNGDILSDGAKISSPSDAATISSPSDAANISSPVNGGILNNSVNISSPSDAANISSPVNGDILNNSVNISSPGDAANIASPVNGDILTNSVNITSPGDAANIASPANGDILSEVAKSSSLANGSVLSDAANHSTNAVDVVLSDDIPVTAEPVPIFVQPTSMFALSEQPTADVTDGNDDDCCGCDDECCDCGDCDCGDCDDCDCGDCGDCDCGDCACDGCVLS